MWWHHVFSKFYDLFHGEIESQSQQINQNSIKVQSFSMNLKFVCAHFSANVWDFSESEWFSLNIESCQFEIVNPLPKVWLQGFCDVLIPLLWDQSAVPVMQLGMQASWIYWDRTICHIVIYLVISDSKMMNALNGAE